MVNDRFLAEVKGPGGSGNRALEATFKRGDGVAGTCIEHRSSPRVTAAEGTDGQEVMRTIGSAMNSAGPDVRFGGCFQHLRDPPSFATNSQEGETTDFSVDL